MFSLLVVELFDLFLIMLLFVELFPTINYFHLSRWLRHLIILVIYLFLPPPVRCLRSWRISCCRQSPRPSSTVLLPRRGSILNSCSAPRKRTSWVCLCRCRQWQQPQQQRHHNHQLRHGHRYHHHHRPKITFAVVGTRYWFLRLV